MSLTNNLCTCYFLSGFWHNYNCGFEYKSICKRSSSVRGNTTAAPVTMTGGCPINWSKINSKVRGHVCFGY